MVFPALGRFLSAQAMKLTQKTVDAITLPKGKSEHSEWDDDLPGFGLRLRRGGARTWVYQYKIAKQNRRIALGNATALSCARARRLSKYMPRFVSDRIRALRKPKAALALVKRWAPSWRIF